jgi:hypothetical protein
MRPSVTSARLNAPPWGNSVQRAASNGSGAATIQACARSLGQLHREARFARRQALALDRGEGDGAARAVVVDPYGCRCGRDRLEEEAREDEPDEGTQPAQRGSTHEFLPGRDDDGWRIAVSMPGSRRGFARNADRS